MAALREYIQVARSATAQSRDQTRRSQAAMSALRSSPSPPRLGTPWRLPSAARASPATPERSSCHSTDSSKERSSARAGEQWRTTSWRREWNCNPTFSRPKSIENLENRLLDRHLSNSLVNCKPAFSSWERLQPTQRPATDARALLQSRVRRAVKSALRASPTAFAGDPRRDKPIFALYSFQSGRHRPSH